MSICFTFLFMSFFTYQYQAGSFSSAVNGLSAFQIANNKAKFSRVEGSQSPQSWRAAACPLEMTSTSCYWHDFSRAFELENRRLPGASHPFSVSEFEKLIRCRTVFFIGDSVALQFWQAVGCLMPLEGAQVKVNWHKTFNDKICPFKAQHCNVASGCVSFPRVAARVCFSLRTSLPNLVALVSARGLDADSIVIANTGLHAHSPKELLKDVSTFLSSLSSPRFPRASRPTVLWFETIAQHFPGHPSGYYNTSRASQYHHCSPIIPEVAYRLDWRNRVLEELLQKAGIPVIRLWELTATMWDAHVAFSGRSDPPFATSDCSHFCIPSITQQWAVALMDKLQEVTSPKPRNCTRRWRTDI
eukprot:GGOE01013900.1.p1 GENE.GGOE01013900.1~~GGOE01013900.1.p1  ORF type:complete len:358 (-),score=23.99 GGOE01013900.1:175-1248(-)